MSTLRFVAPAGLVLGACLVIFAATGADADQAKPAAPAGQPAGQPAAPPASKPATSAPAGAKPAAPASPAAPIAAPPKKDDGTPARRATIGEWMAQVSYSIGHDLGKDTRLGLEKDGVKFDADALVKGFADALKDSKDVMLTKEQRDDVLAKFQAEVTSRKARARLESDPVYKALADQNLKKNKDFLEGFGKKPGAAKLDNGIQYIVRKTGDGPSPKVTDTVTLNYQGMLIDGYEFGRGRDVSVPISGLMEGARDVLTHMKVGDHWFVAIPANLAYGEWGRDPDIGPNESLVFDVELLGIGEKK